jgi:MraZ protein
MLNLLDEHSCRVDNKGRMMFPAKWRKQLEQVLHHGLVVNRDIFERCLVVYPKPEWDKVQEEMSRLSRYDEDHRQFQRKFLKGATAVELDSAGRLLIPAALLDYMQVDTDENNEIIACGTGETIELWSKANYDQEVLDDDFDFKSLAKKVRQDIEKKSGTND